MARSENRTATDRRGGGITFSGCPSVSARMSSTPAKLPLKYVAQNIKIRDPISNNFPLTPLTADNFGMEQRVVNWNNALETTGTPLGGDVSVS